MDQFGVQLALEDLREVKRVWMKSKREFDHQWMDSFIRLLHEAAINYMSVDQVSKASGLTRRRIRSIMRDHGLDPKRTKTVLSKTAAEAVQNNAAQLGVKPDQISLLSPLAYLPLGSQAPETEGDRCRCCGATLETEEPEVVTLSEQDTEGQGLPEGDERVGWLEL